MNIPSTCIQPKNFADYLSSQQKYCLFLDIDGTLADFTLDPRDSVIPNATLILLQKIQSHDVKIAIVTGRSLAEARQMVSPIQLPIAATHGLEIAFDNSFNTAINRGSDNDVTGIAHVNTIELATIRQSIIQSCLPYDDFIIEDKPYSVALHFRQNLALADMAYTIMLKTLENHTNWILKQGKYVWEIVPKGADKGTAILTLLKKMQTNNKLCPIFIGDDITDEVGFTTVQIENRTVEKTRNQVKGMGIKVGKEPTCAHYYVHDVYEVSILLNSFLTFCQKHTTPLPALADATLSIAKNSTRDVI